MPTNNSWNSTDPVQVALGGTGNASSTAYAVLCGGTTSTAPQQSVASVGTTGQVLTSNGAGALPTFQSVSGSTAFNTVVVQTFTSSGTYTPTANMKYCTIEVVGGGGGTGGCVAPTSGNGNVGSGGGGGGYARKTVSAATIGASQAVTVGTGGTAGNTSGTNGGAGGTSSVGSIVSATGGAGGGGANFSGTIFLDQGVLGGVGSGGDINCHGGPSTSSLYYAGGCLCSSGGNSYFGGGAPGTAFYANSIPGTAGTTYGGGASGGGAVYNTGAVAGAVGGAGVVIITEYCH